MRFQPTRPLRGATQTDAWFGYNIQISTHAPLAGRDRKVYERPPLVLSISTHAPLAGRDIAIMLMCVRYTRFQPTRPLRGATVP